MIPEAAPLADAAPLAEDFHTHTAFSDGRDSLDAMVRAAAGAGLRTLYVTDHVRRDTRWLPEYTRAVREAARRAAPLRVVCGVEVKILDTAGRLDLPPDLTGVRHVAVADHRFPLPGGPAAPGEVRDLLAAGELGPEQALDALTEATVAAVHSVPASCTRHLAHLFSVLPKAGLSEDAVGPERLARIAAACRETGTAVEANEKWRCPGPAALAALRRHGVHLVAGSDAHTAEAVGAWSYAASVLAGGDGAAPGDPTGRPAP
ncbi:PHP domain-containing protein [Streptomyces sp. NPDC006134]|uniref:PHP domain-containing protein n=1 Tax=Streptomyces sp. NPDC006134 TaxID=3154467 RepID=UPI0033DEFC69